MTKTSIKQATVGSKKAAEPVVVNEVVSEPAEKRTKFQMVAAGVCPHDEAPLLQPVKTKGVGLKLDCSQCGHTWYINKRIKTCGCLTCRGARRRSVERSITLRNVQSMVKNSGGPWLTVPELLFEKKGLIPAIQQLLVSHLLR